MIRYYYFLTRQLIKITVFLTNDTTRDKSKFTKVFINNKFLAWFETLSCITTCSLLTMASNTQLHRTQTRNRQQ